MPCWRRNAVEQALQSLEIHGIVSDLTTKKNFISEKIVLPWTQTTENEEKIITNTQIEAKNHSIWIHAFTVRAEIQKKKDFSKKNSVSWLKVIL